MWFITTLDTSRSDDISTCILDTSRSVSDYISKYVVSVLQLDTTRNDDISILRLVSSCNTDATYCQFILLIFSGNNIYIYINRANVWCHTTFK